MVPRLTSKSPGEFTRSDLNPLDTGALSMEEMASASDDEKGLAIFLGVLAASAGQLRNAEEGVDDHPITAQEAWTS